MRAERPAGRPGVARGDVRPGRAARAGGRRGRSRGDGGRARDAARAAPARRSRSPSRRTRTATARRRRWVPPPPVPQGPTTGRPPRLAGLRRMVLLLAFSLTDRVEKYGAYVGVVAFFGLAVLTILYFAQARELKRLREWAGRAPERAREAEERVVAQAEAARRVQTERARGRRAGAGARPRRGGRRPPRRAAATAAATAAAAGRGRPSRPRRPSTAVVQGPARRGRPARRASAARHGASASPSRAGDSAARATQAPASRGAAGDRGRRSAGRARTPRPRPRPTPTRTPSRRQPTRTSGDRPRTRTTPDTDEDAAELRRAPVASGSNGTVVLPGAPRRDPARELRPARDARADPPPPPGAAGDRRSAARSTFTARAPRRTGRPPPRRQRRGRRRPLARPARSRTRRVAVLVAAALVFAGTRIFGGVRRGARAEPGGGDHAPRPPTPPTAAARGSGDDRTAPAPGPTAPGTTVAVLNGTLSAGLAGTTADKVGHRGYKRGTTGNFTDQNRSASVIYYGDGARSRGTRRRQRS